MEPRYKVGDLVRLNHEVPIVGMIIEILGNDLDYPVTYLNKFEKEIIAGKKVGLYR